MLQVHFLHRDSDQSLFTAFSQNSAKRGHLIFRNKPANKALIYTAKNQFISLLWWDSSHKNTQPTLLYSIRKDKEKTSNMNWHPFLLPAWTVSYLSLVPEILYFLPNHRRAQEKITCWRQAKSWRAQVEWLYQVTCLHREVP